MLRTIWTILASLILFAAEFCPFTYAADEADMQAFVKRSQEESAREVARLEGQLQSLLRQKRSKQSAQEIKTIKQEIESLKRTNYIPAALEFPLHPGAIGNTFAVARIIRVLDGNSIIVDFEFSPENPRIPGVIKIRAVGHDLSVVYTLQGGRALKIEQLADNQPVRIDQVIEVTGPEEIDGERLMAFKPFDEALLKPLLKEQPTKTKPKH